MPRPHDLPCPCRAREPTPVRYVDCCGRWHAGFGEGLHAPTPEALMRSRYSAYALAQGRASAVSAAAVKPASLVDYLLQTWHPSSAPGELDLSPLNWTGLDLLHAQTQGDAGVVEFVAHHKVGGRAHKLHELSRFVREAGAWRYVDGVVAPDDAQAEEARAAGRTGGDAP